MHGLVPAASEVGSSGSVWILEGVEGPACLMSKGRPGTQLLPCWADRAQAEMRLIGPGKDMVCAEIGLAAFCDRLWLWVAETGRLVAPAFCEGDGVIACQAPDRVAGLAEAATDGGVAT